MDKPCSDKEFAGVKGPQCDDDDDGDREDAIDSVGEKILEAIDSAGDTMLLKAGSRGIVSCDSWTLFDGLPWKFDWLSNWKVWKES